VSKQKSNMPDYNPSTSSSRAERGGRRDKVSSPSHSLRGRAPKELHQGIIEAYIHQNKKIGAMVELRCETDFVARTEEFKKLGHELCLQIAAMNPKKSSFLRQPWIRDETKTIKDLIDDYISKTGENIVVKRFNRYKI